MNRTTLLVGLSSSLGVALALTLALAACSQSTAHPDPLGDCKSAYGCNPALGIPANSGSTSSDDSGAHDAASDAPAADTGIKDAATGG